jgi:hypothetical protein
VASYYIRNIATASARTLGAPGSPSTYLPSASPTTRLPRETGSDLAFQIRRIEEKWRRFHPRLVYYPISLAEIGEVSAGLPAGSATNYDPLTLELVSAPASGAAPANRKKFLSPAVIHIALSREARDDELKLYGFDKVRDVIARIPLSLLDAAGVRARPGDEFVWGEERFEVVDANKVGYWKNTTVRLFMALNCQTARAGS